MRELGDVYVKSEFKQHKSVTNPEQLEQFFDAWTSYLDHINFSGKANQSLSPKNAVLNEEAPVTLTSSASKFSYGKALAKDIELTDDQFEKLKALKEESTKLK